MCMTITHTTHMYAAALHRDRPRHVGEGQGTWPGEAATTVATGVTAALLLRVVYERTLHTREPWLS